MEAPITIQAKHIFGVKADTHNPIAFLSETEVVYSAGHNLVVYNTEDRQQQVVPCIEGSLGVSCLCLCPQRTYLAVAEKAERAVVSVYNIRKQRKLRTLVTSDCISHEYISMAFTSKPDTKILATMGGAPDWALVVWQWDRQKVLFSTKVSTGPRVFQVSFNGHDFQNGLVATGENIFRWYKPVDGQLKQQNTGIHKKESHLSSNYLCHSWLDDGRLIVVTDLGEMLLFDHNCEYKQYYTSGLENWSALLVSPCPNGFLVAGDEARIVMFERNTDDATRTQYVRLQKSLCVASQPTARVRGMAVSPNGDTLALVLDNSQIYTLSMSAEREDAEPLSDLFHSSGITGMDVCVRKPLVVTCGHDNSIRIWDYAEKKLEVVEFFNEEPYSVAFHPSGFHIVVGFADKLRMMNVFANSVKTYKELHIKACREVRFSHGGHLFAASNNHLIQVFNFYTGENPPQMQFKGHSGKVASLHWNEEDTIITSTGWDGAVFEWHLQSKAEQGTTPKHYVKGIKFSSIVGTASGKLLLAGNDKEIKEVAAGESRTGLPTGSLVGHLALLNSERLLLAGVSEPEKTGALRGYSCEPFDGEYFEVQAHSQPVERLRVSADDTHLFTAGADGSLIVFEVKDSRALRHERDGYPAFANEILVTKAEVEELNGELDRLIVTGRELDENNKLQFNLEIQEKDDEIEKLKTKIDQEANTEKQRYTELLENKKRMEGNYEDTLVELEAKFKQEEKELERLFKIKYNKEVERCHELSKEREVMARDAAEEIETLRSNHIQAMAIMENNFKTELEEIRHEIEQLNQHSEDMQLEYEARRLRLEEVNERQIYDLREQNVKEIHDIKNDCDESQTELELARKVELTLQKDKGEKAKLVDSMEKHLEGQRSEITKLNDDLKTHTNEIKVRKKTIKDKQRRIQELNKKTQELTKFKFVLDYKIRELKKDTGPREEEISRLKEQTEEMEKEIKHLKSVNEKLAILVENLKLNLDGMQNELKDQDDALKKNRSKIQAYKDGIYDTVQHIQEEKKLKEGVLHLYEKFVRNETESKAANTEKEYVRQCNHLESTIAGLRRKLKKTHEVHGQSVKRIMNQNEDLITEINGLRKELKHRKYLKEQVKLLEKGAKKVPHEDVLRREFDRQQADLVMLRKRLSDLQEESPTN